MSDCLSSPRGHSGHFAKFHMLKFTKVYFLHSFHLNFNQSVYGKYDNQGGIQATCTTPFGTICQNLKHLRHLEDVTLATFPSAIILSWFYVAKDRVELQGPCAPPPFFILHNYYHLQAFTSWNKVSIDKVVILTGVQQGSVLSPHLFIYFLFCCYI